MVKRIKRKYKYKNIFKLFTIIILFSLILHALNTKKVEKNIIPKEKSISYINNIDYNGLNIEKNLENKIIKYMNTYFKSMTTLEEIDMTYMFSKDSFEEAYLHQTAISTLINTRKMERNDMKICNAKYDIIYKDIIKEDNKIIVTFLENDHLHFNFMKEIESNVYGVKNIFTFDEDYKITSIRKIQDFYVMITNSYETGKKKQEAIKELDKIKINHLNDSKKQINIWKEDLIDYNQNINKPEITCDHKYDRKKALNYAKKYITSRNQEWISFDEIGGNCQNFASQIIYSGGVPMDTLGEAEQQWKNYGSDKFDETNDKKGRSSSWTAVPNFYVYVKKNKGYGLCAEPDINPFYAEEGDIGHVGYNGLYTHAVVVVGKIKNKNGEITDLLINSNTTNLENYPLSGYVYPLKRIIKIAGWNDK